MIPVYLPCDSFVCIALDDRMDPTALLARTGILYEDNLNLTDDRGNVAFIDCHLRPVSPTAPIRASHPEYRKAGGGRASHESMDAGHLGLALSQWLIRLKSYRITKSTDLYSVSFCTALRRSVDTVPRRMVTRQHVAP